jgi:mRNA interferase MazF
MTNYKRGDVVLVNFVFSDESRVKRRPALVLSTDEYNNGRQEVIVAAITSNTQRILIGDYLLTHWQKVGLLYPSVVTGIFRTIKNQMIYRKLGELSDDDMKAVEQKARHILGL